MRVAMIILAVSAAIAIFGMIIIAEILSRINERNRRR